MASLGFSGWLAATDRSPLLFVLAAIALIAIGIFRRQLTHLQLGPSGIDMAIDQKQVEDQLEASDQPADIKLLISTGIPTGMARTMMGSDWIVQVTVVNTAATPIGVDGLSFEVTDARTIPLLTPTPTVGNKSLPAVLLPQEKATYWIDRNDLRDRLRDEHVRLSAMLAYLADGTHRREAVPGDWRQLGDPE
ncbi:MAG TPA: hypothetical protein VIM30_01720 [Candidatus Limnocylindrales bacterium]